MAPSEVISQPMYRTSADVFNVASRRAPDSRTRQHVDVRSPVDLIELPYAFTQLPLLMPDGFIRAARERGVALSEPQLDGLHRFKLLVPTFRVKRDGRAIRSYARERPMLARQLAQWQPTTRTDLLQARDERRLFAAIKEPFVGRDRRRRDLDGLPYLTSEYLCSQHHLLGTSALIAFAPSSLHAERARR